MNSSALRELLVAVRWSNVRPYTKYVVPSMRRCLPLAGRTERAADCIELAVAKDDFRESQDVFGSHAVHQALPGDGEPGDEDEKDVR